MQYENVAIPSSSLFNAQLFNLEYKQWLQQCPWIKKTKIVSFNQRIFSKYFEEFKDKENPKYKEIAKTTLNIKKFKSFIDFIIYFFFEL